MHVRITVVLLLSAILSVTACEARQPAVVTLRRLPSGGIQPQAVSDGTGRIHLIYFSGLPSGGDLFYVTSDDDGVTLAKPIRVNSDAGTAIATGTVRGGQLALGKNARAHVTWNDARGAQVFYSRMNAAGTAFEKQRGLMQRTLNLDGGGGVAADGAGNVYVAWHGNDAHGSSRDEAGRAVWIARSSDEGATFGPEAPVWTQPTGVCGCCGLALLAEGRTVHLLYRSATALVNRDIYFLSSPDSARTFRGAKIHDWPINACPMTTMAFARAGERLLGAWETEGKVYLSELTPLTSKAAKPVAPGMNKVPAKHPRIAVNARNESLLVWTEGTGWSRGGSLAWQLFDGKGNAVSPSGKAPALPAWSFAAAVARRDGTFVVFY